MSFGEVLAVPWKSNLVLDCIHVGIPNPSVQWLHKMRPIQENSKHQVRCFVFVELHLWWQNKTVKSNVNFKLANFLFIKSIEIKSLQDTIFLSSIWFQIFDISKNLRLWWFLRPICYNWELTSFFLDFPFVTKYVWKSNQKLFFFTSWLVGWFKWPHLSFFWGTILNFNCFHVNKNTFLLANWINSASKSAIINAMKMLCNLFQI